MDIDGFPRVALLTQPDRDRVVRLDMKQLRWRLAKDYRVQWAWTVEAGPKTGNVHMHVLLKGDYIPQSRLSTLCEKSGLGEWCTIAPAYGEAGRYAAKAGRYAGKSLGDWSNQLHLSSGRGWHVSRGWTGGEPLRSYVASRPASTDAGPWVPYSGSADVGARQ